MVHGHEGTKRCPICLGSRFGPFYVLLLEKKITCCCVKKKIMLICVCVMY